jgi:hypothetical protein
VDVIVAVSVGVSVGGMGVHVAVCEGVGDGVLVSVAGTRMDSGLPRQLARNNVVTIHRVILLERWNLDMSRLYPSFSRASF